MGHKYARNTRAAFKKVWEKLSGFESAPSPGGDEGGAPAHQKTARAKAASKRKAPNGSAKGPATKRKTKKQKEEEAAAAAVKEEEDENANGDIDDDEDGEDIDDGKSPTSPVIFQESREEEEFNSRSFGMTMHEYREFRDAAEQGHYGSNTLTPVPGSPLSEVSGMLLFGTFQH